MPLDLDAFYLRGHRCFLEIAMRNNTFSISARLFLEIADVLDHLLDFLDRTAIFSRWRLLSLDCGILLNSLVRSSSTFSPPRAETRTLFSIAKGCSPFHCSGDCYCTPLLLEAHSCPPSLKPGHISGQKELKKSIRCPSFQDNACV